MAAPDDRSQSSGRGAVGQGNHTVRQGDCIESIAFDHGFFWETLWNHTENASVKRRRQDHNALLPGDRVFIPERRAKQVDGATEQRHRFRRRGVPSRFVVRLMRFGEPRADEPYVVVIDGEIISGRTDENGRLAVRIPPNARNAVLLLNEGQEEHNLSLGHLDPVNEVSGVQARLNNLGYSCGPADGVLGERTRRALGSFQVDQGLEPTGEVDEPTKSRLEEAY